MDSSGDKDRPGVLTLEILVATFASKDFAGALEMLEPYREEGGQVFPFAINDPVSPIGQLLYYGSYDFEAKVEPAAQVAVLEALLDCRADVNGPCYDGGTTPLHLACGWARPASARLLLNRGANVHGRNTNGDTVFHGRFRLDETYLLILGAGCDPLVTIRQSTMRPHLSKPGLCAALIGWQYFPLAFPRGLYTWALWERALLGDLAPPAPASVYVPPAEPDSDGDLGGGPLTDVDEGDGWNLFGGVEAFSSSSSDAALQTAAASDLVAPMRLLAHLPIEIRHEIACRVYCGEAGDDAILILGDHAVERRHLQTWGDLIPSGHVSEASEFRRCLWDEPIQGLVKADARIKAIAACAWEAFDCRWPGDGEPVVGRHRVYQLYLIRRNICLAAVARPALHRVVVDRSSALASIAGLGARLGAVFADRGHVGLVTDQDWDDLEAWANSLT